MVYAFGLQWRNHYVCLSKNRTKMTSIKHTGICVKVYLTIKYSEREYSVIVRSVHCPRLWCRHSRIHTRGFIISKASINRAPSGTLPATGTSVAPILSDKRCNLETMAFKVEKTDIILIQAKCYHKIIESLHFSL